MSMADPFNELRAAYHAASVALDRAIEEACPAGAEGHRPVQHRDGKPPWCGSCRLTRQGHPIDSQWGAIAEGQQNLPPKTQRGCFS